jgi:hypothetical protein
MTKQCNFCGNTYDINEDCCPFCLAENEDTETITTNKTTKRTMTITRNVNGKVTTETKSFCDGEFEFANKSVDELRDEIEKLLNSDDIDINAKNIKVSTGKSKNLIGVIIGFSVIFAIIMMIIPMFVVFNFAQMDNYELYDGNEYDYSYEYDEADDFETDTDLYQQSNKDWQEESRKLDNLMQNNTGCYFLTNDGNLYYLHEKIMETDMSTTKYTWWLYYPNYNEWYPHSGSDTTTVSPMYILDAKISIDLDGLISDSAWYGEVPIEITKSERFQEIIFGN